MLTKAFVLLPQGPNALVPNQTKANKANKSFCVLLLSYGAFKVLSAKSKSHPFSFK